MEYIIVCFDDNGDEIGHGFEGRLDLSTANSCIDTIEESIGTSDEDSFRGLWEIREVDGDDVSRDSIRSIDTRECDDDEESDA